MPEHPVHQLTTGELADRKRDLERRLQRRLTERARGQLQASLAEVIAEEEDRERLAASRGTWPLTN